MSSMDKKQENFRKMESLSNFSAIMKFYMFVNLTNGLVLLRPYQVIAVGIQKLISGVDFIKVLQAQIPKVQKRLTA